MTQASPIPLSQWEAIDKPDPLQVPYRSFDAGPLERDGAVECTHGLLVWAETVGPYKVAVMCGAAVGYQTVLLSRGKVRKLARIRPLASSAIAQLQREAQETWEDLCRDRAVAIETAKLAVATLRERHAPRRRTRGAEDWLRRQLDSLSG